MHRCRHARWVKQQGILRTLISTAEGIAARTAPTADFPLRPGEALVGVEPGDLYEKLPVPQSDGKPPKHKMKKAASGTISVTTQRLVFAGPDRRKEWDFASLLKRPLCGHDLDARAVPLAPSPIAPSPTAPSPTEAAAPRPTTANPHTAAPTTTRPHTAPHTTATTAQAIQGVHPGAFCSEHGEYGYTDKGLKMICSVTATDSRYRWRSA